MKNKINIRLFEDFRSDQKYYSFVYRELFDITKYFTANSVKTGVNDDMIDGGRWLIEGRPTIPSGCRKTESTLILYGGTDGKDNIVVDYEITETKKHTADDATGPVNDYDVDITVVSITYSVDEYSVDYEINVTGEIEKVLEEIIIDIAQK